MLDEAALEKRLLDLEAEVASLKRQSQVRQGSGNWLEHLIGSISNEAVFDQILAYGRAFRDADRPVEQDE
jgi:hypothetical protein